MQQLGDEINIVCPTDVLKMLDEENDGPSTSASIAKEIVPASDLPKQATEVPEGQPGPGALTGKGPSAVVVLSSDDSEPDMPLPVEAGPSVEAGISSPVEEFDLHVWLDFSDPKWDRARNQLQGLVNSCLDLSLQKKRSGLGFYQEQTGHYYSDVSLRVCLRPVPDK